MKGRNTSRIDLPPAECRKELAKILAEGLLRLFSRGASAPENAPSETTGKALDVSPESDPVVSRLTNPRP